MERKALIIIVLALVVFVASYMLNQPDMYVKDVGGINVESTIPFEDVTALREISLGNYSDMATLTCGLELSAISTPSLYGYRVNMEYGDTGVKIGRDSAVVRGRTSNELLSACHAFACVREGLECPPSFDRVKSMVYGSDVLTIVLDVSLPVEGGMAYAEILGLYGYIQASRADLNGDRTFEQWEINNNSVYIYPFLMNGTRCTLQSMNNLIQKLNASGASVDCSELGGIFLLNSPDNKISLEDDRVVIEGDGRRVRSGVAIVRDTVSPEYIRKVYRFE